MLILSLVKQPKSSFNRSTRQIQSMIAPCAVAVGVCLWFSLRVNAHTVEELAQGYSLAASFAAEQDGCSSGRKVERVKASNIIGHLLSSSNTFRNSKKKKAIWALFLGPFSSIFIDYNHKSSGMRLAL